MKKQLELKLNVNTLPPPTIPATSWADYADFRIMPSSLLKVAIGGRTSTLNLSSSCFFI